jgi:hypothetical protein
MTRLDCLRCDWADLWKLGGLLRVSAGDALLEILDFARRAVAFAGQLLAHRGENDFSLPAFRPPGFDAHRRAKPARRRKIWIISTHPADLVGQIVRPLAHQWLTRRLRARLARVITIIIIDTGPRYWS